ncbi:MAG: Fe-S protein assembly co-chaperone HscB [Acidobacteria bacterium]|nr:Fe-S protein assembly co-chaperone HscB [Acidobacteriota bacterium]
MPPTIQACRECGGGAPIDAHFCPQCSKILSLGQHGDYFAFLGLPRRLMLDAADLEQRFRMLSRQFHPDFFYNAAPAERRASLERSSYLNDAYRTLKQPVSRIEYLLQLEGAAARTPQEQSRQVPPALLEEVFALNEELDEIRGQRAAGAAARVLAPRLERARQPIERRRDEHERQLAALSAEWDALLDRAAAPAARRPVLDALRECMLERNYIRNLLAGIERELGD